MSLETIIKFVKSQEGQMAIIGVFLIVLLFNIFKGEPKTDPPETFVPNANHVVLVYADWCGHCQKFKPEWRKFRRMARNMPKLRTSELDVDDKTNKAMIKSLDANTFPTVVMIKPTGEKIKYSGDRSSVDLMRWAGN